MRTNLLVRSVLQALCSLSALCMLGFSFPANAWELIDIPEGTAHIGSLEGEADERPIRAVHVNAFRITKTEITNAEFAQFVQETGHITQAEKIGWGWVWNRRWNRVNGADWRHPEGPESPIRNPADHPVVQVSWQDARAFCEWHGLRLPTDVEWEYAARGSDQRRYPWGNAAPRSQSIQHANYGTDTCCAADDQDGYLFTSSVGSYPEGASPFGILDMAGNVWEWVEDDHPRQPGWKTIRGGGWGNNPYCLRTSYRHSNRPSARLDMVGFRCAAGK